MALPFLLMVVLSLTLAALSALDSALSSLGIVTWFNGLRWLRVHFITLGTLVELMFGLLPTLVAANTRQSRPAMRWDIWLTLNLGLLSLLVGIPLINGVIIFVGGTFVFIAALLLWKQLRDLHPTFNLSYGFPFYLAGLSYLLLGIILGTGLWLGWGPWLRVAAPKELHLHANLWGFTSLTFAGLLVDLYPRLTGQAFAFPRSRPIIFWLLMMGALVLIVQPWTGITELLIPGMALHQLATIGLLLNISVPLLRKRDLWSTGWAHLGMAYVWLIAPMLILPVVLLRGGVLPMSQIEANGPPFLVYNWVLSFLIAVVPYLFTQTVTPHAPARLGGTRISWSLAQIAGLMLTFSIFNADQQATLQGIAYGLWALALLPIVWQLLSTMRVALQTSETFAA